MTPKDIIRQQFMDAIARFDYAAAAMFLLLDDSWDSSDKEFYTRALLQIVPITYLDTVRLSRKDPNDLIQLDKKREIVQVLISRGANVHVRGGTVVYPYETHSLLWTQRVEQALEFGIIQQLIDAGVHINERDTNGFTLLRTILGYNNEFFVELADYLKSKGGVA